MSPIEARIPACGEWARRITAVAEFAKTGYDWGGPFLKPRHVSKST